MSTINILETLLLLQATQLTEQTVVIETHITDLRPKVEAREAMFNGMGGRVSLDDSARRYELIEELNRQYSLTQEMIEMSLEMKLQAEADARKHIGDVRVSGQVLNDMLEATRVFAKTADEYMALMARSSFTTTQMLKAIGA